MKNDTTRNINEEIPTSAVKYSPADNNEAEKILQGHVELAKRFTIAYCQDEVKKSNEDGKDFL